jgi:ATP-dependent DNA helicase RecG
MRPLKRVTRVMRIRPQEMKKTELADQRRNQPIHSEISDETPVQYIKGVGPARSKLLAKLGIRTLNGLLFYIPWRSEDRKNLKRISDLASGSHETTTGKVISSKIITTPRKRMKILEVSISDSTGVLRCRWFNQPFLKKHFIEGRNVIVSGIIKGDSLTGFGPEMENPDFEPVGGEDRLIHTSRIVPVYKTTEGLTQKQLRSLMFNAIETCSSTIREYMPENILLKCGLRPLAWSLREAHFPEEITDISALNEARSTAHRRLSFDELFLLEIGLVLMKKRESSKPGIAFSHKRVLVNKLLQNLSFSLTSAQERVIGEITSDMQRAAPMNRLVHGDVGCGKTVVALIAMLIAVENGYQACLMAPTELLSEQHYINIHSMVENLGLQVVLLTSGAREKPVGEVAEGQAQIIIGTHSLIQEKVKFNRLGLAVIDEQHKFGVMQRADLRKKGINPDILIMTATPIPRTLALTLYGDLDVSVIDELPSGRKPVTTRVVFPGQREMVYSLIREELSRGRQVYIVYPLIEGSEKLDLKPAIDGAEALRKIFPDHNVGLVHGKMGHDEREEIMSLFKEGKIGVLVATTVIEVGMDVPNASLMLIVHAERFGLSQLHQLRGRIGRGEYESYCLMMAYPPMSDDAKMRLKAMESTGDGFRIAEHDLSIRGHGDFFGTRQSGLPDVKVANLFRDRDILEMSRKEAFALAEASPDLADYPALKGILQKKWMGRLELVKS